MRIQRSEEFERAAALIRQICEIEPLAEGALSLDAHSLYICDWAADTGAVEYPSVTDILVNLPGIQEEDEAATAARAALAAALAEASEYLPMMDEKCNGSRYSEAFAAVKLHLGYN